MSRFAPSPYIPYTKQFFDPNKDNKILKDALNVEDELIQKIRMVNLRKRYRFNPVSVPILSNHKDKITEKALDILSKKGNAIKQHKKFFSEHQDTDHNEKHEEIRRGYDHDLIKYILDQRHKFNSKKSEEKKVKGTMFITELWDNKLYKDVIRASNFKDIFEEIDKKSRISLQGRIDHLNEHFSKRLLPIQITETMASLKILDQPDDTHENFITQQQLPIDRLDLILSERLSSPTKDTSTHNSPIIKRKQSKMTLVNSNGTTPKNKNVKLPLLTSSKNPDTINYIHGQCKSEDLLALPSSSPLNEEEENEQQEQQQNIKESILTTERHSIIPNLYHYHHTKSQSISHGTLNDSAKMIIDIEMAQSNHITTDYKKNSMSSSPCLKNKPSTGRKKTHFNFPNIISPKSVIEYQLDNPPNYDFIPSTTRDQTKKSIEFNHVSDIRTIIHNNLEEPSEFHNPYLKAKYEKLDKSSYIANCCEYLNTIMDNCDDLNKKDVHAKKLMHKPKQESSSSSSLLVLPVTDRKRKCCISQRKESKFSIEVKKIIKPAQK